MSSAGTTGIGVGEGHLRSSGLSGHLGGGREGGYVASFPDFFELIFSSLQLLVVYIIKLLSSILS